MATNAVYKVYSGSEWVEYHFTTNAGQVSTTTGRKFVTSSITVNSNTAGTTGAKVTVGSGDAANIEVDGAHITGQASVSSGSLTYISASDSIAAALGKLDQAAKAAYDNIPSGILTSTNSPDLAAIEALTGTAGFLKKTAANTWALDTNTYLTAVTINGSSGSSFTLDGTTLKYNSTGDTTIKSAIDSVASVANGITMSFAIDETYTASMCQNSQFASTADSLVLEDIGYQEFIHTVGGGTVYIKDLKIGDTIFIAGTNIPDRWLAAIGSPHEGERNYTFYKLETYNMTWGAISGKPTLSVSGQTVTIGSDSVTVPALAGSGSATTAAKSDHNHDSTYLKLSGNTSSTAMTGALWLGAHPLHFDDGDEFINIVSSTMVFSADGDNYKFKGDDGHDATLNLDYLTVDTSFLLKNTGGVSTNTLATEEFVAANYKKITVAENAPSSPATGDIWIDV